MFDLKRIDETYWKKMNVVMKQSLKSFDKK